MLLLLLLLLRLLCFFLSIQGEADRLAALDTNWVGRKVVRGCCTLVAGLVQCLQRDVIRGVWHIVRSWQWLKALRTEALEYDGVGREIVRSAALMTLGAFALVLSLLPQQVEAGKRVR